MNERIGNSKIYALAKEAGLIEFEQFAWNPELGSPTYESVAKARKFAELIVLECMTTVLKESKWYWDKDEFESANAIQNAARRVKEHFGVEE